MHATAPPHFGRKKVNMDPSWPPKSIKNRCRAATRLDLRLLLNCSSPFGPNFDLRDLKNPAPAAARARFLKNQLSKLTSMFDSVWVPSWPHVWTKNRRKYVQRSTPRSIEKGSSFGSIFRHLGSILGAKLGPCWRLFRPKIAQRSPKTRPRTPKSL